MDKKIVGLIGAISGLAALDGTQASAIAAPNPADVTPARSYAELLNPISNALALLRAADEAAAQGTGTIDEDQTPVKMAAHHHHHHHHQRRKRHHHHHH